MNPQVGFLLNKALAALRASNLESANLYLKQALRFENNNAHVLRLLGVVAAQSGKNTEALEYVKSSLKYLPKNALALSNLGNIYFALKQYKNALNAFDQSIKLDPNYYEVWTNKGNVLHELELYEDALICHDKSISLQMGYPEAWTNKGNALYELGRYKLAVEHHNTALTLKPDYYQAWTNKAIALFELGLYEEAIAHCDKALMINPEYSEAEWSKCLPLLLQGDFQRGLPLYESRWRAGKITAPEDKRSFDKPTWLGDVSLQDKTILLYGEQGLGDFIQFCRYAKPVSNLGARVILEVPPALESLLVSLDGVSQFITKGKPIPAFDYQCPLLSLPLAMQTSIESIPNPGTYITFDNNSVKAEEWSKRLGTKTKLRIGLVWSGNPRHKNDRNRSLLLSELVTYLPDGFEYISLQNEIRAVDQETLESNPQIQSFAADLHDFSDTAALIGQLDLVISVDTSVAHLSGALGRQTWMLLPYVPDWRWMLERVDSPWYPSMTLYRQSVKGNWGDVLKKIHFDLIEMNEKFGKFPLA